MLFVWGEGIHRHPAGWVAEFCPVCTKITRCLIDQLLEYKHVYGQPTTTPEERGHLLDCTDCRTLRSARAEDYASFKGEEADDLEDLIQKTHPEVRSRRAERLELEERRRSGRLSDEERLSLAREAFVEANSLLVYRAAKVHFDATSAAALFATAACGAAAAVVGLILQYPLFSLPPRPSDHCQGNGPVSITNSMRFRAVKFVSLDDNPQTWER